MKRADAIEIHINDAIDDDALVEMKTATDAAAPGEWYARCFDAGTPRAHPERAHVVRHDKTVVDDMDSVRFMAKARGWVPRLIRWVNVIEQALMGARAAATSWRMTALREREEHEQALERAKVGETGREEGLRELLLYARLGGHNDAYLIGQLKRWASGADITTEVRGWREDVERRLREELPEEEVVRVLAGHRMELADVARMVRARVEQAERARPPKVVYPDELALKAATRRVRALEKILRRIQKEKLHFPDSDMREYCAGCGRSPYNEPPHNQGCIVVALDRALGDEKPDEPGSPL